jgi:kynureninase
MSSAAGDLSRHRERFPIFAQRTYLASACMGPFPREGHADIEEYRRTRQLANRALGLWFQQVEEVTGLIEQLLHAPPGSVALRSSATACQAAIVSSIEPLGARRRIVVSELDFHSALQLYSAQPRRGFEVHTVRSVDGVRVQAEDLVAAIDERTAIVAVSLVSRHHALLDAGPVIARAREVGAVVILDAYQAAGVVPLDVGALDVDVLVGGVHKWLSGATGLAFAYVRRELADRLEPAYPGWFGHHDIADYVHEHTFEDTYRPIPGARRFQQGTPPVFPIYASRAGLRFVLEVGVDHIRARNLELTTRLLEGALERGIDVVTPREPEARAGAVCLRVPDPERVVARLEERGIDVDQRRRQVVRAAPHACSTELECDKFLSELAEIVRTPGR